MILDIISRPSPNFNDRPAGGDVKYLILHYTGMGTGQEALERLCDAEAQVSAHYLVEEDGRIFSLVSEDKRAWHAGASAWEQDRDINGLSIGIELVNPGHDQPGYKGDYRSFPKPQMTSLTNLCQSILSRHEIKPWHILGHSDVAPLRKIDPGELFDWRGLAQSGIGVWPDPNIPSSASVTPENFREKLAQYGYSWSDGEEKMAEIISAFQRHFRPRDFSGGIDEECCKILENLLAQKDYGTKPLIGY